MRHPSASKGKAPSTCHECRTAHPDESWCDFHDRPHPKSQFQPTPKRPIGVLNICREAVNEQIAQARRCPDIECVSCGQLTPSRSFRGGRAKAPTCNSCESRHPGQRWCVDCRDWLPQSAFHRTGEGGKFWTVRCKPCKTAYAHGVTVRHILARQGVERPQCGACGSVEDLKIDHDHACCPSANGCERCVRGYLCHPCNTAEGLLRTPDRARLLAEYMERVAVSSGRATSEAIA